MAETIELPKDAEGREIPLDTRTLYDKDGKAVHVLRWVFLPLADEGLRWRVESTEFPHGGMPEGFHLTTPDSWERLFGDLRDAGETGYLVQCGYYGRSRTDCRKCPRSDDDVDCMERFTLDLIERINRLREAEHD